MAGLTLSLSLSTREAGHLRLETLDLGYVADELEKQYGAVSQEAGLQQDN
jgi:hypothetical protein